MHKFKAIVLNQWVPTFYRKQYNAKKENLSSCVHQFIFILLDLSYVHFSLNNWTFYTGVAASFISQSKSSIKIFKTPGFRICLKLLPLGGSVQHTTPTRIVSGIVTRASCGQGTTHKTPITKDRLQVFNGTVHAEMPLTLKT